MTSFDCHRPGGWRGERGHHVLLRLATVSHNPPQRRGRPRKHRQPHFISFFGCYLNCTPSSSLFGASFLILRFFLFINELASSTLFSRIPESPSSWGAGGGGWEADKTDCHNAYYRAKKTRQGTRKKKYGRDKGRKKLPIFVVILVISSPLTWQHK